MIKKLLFKAVTIFLVFVLGLFCFYKFMTYDRRYIWSKEYKDELITVAKENGFKVSRTDEIAVAEIKRSTKKAIKIRIQKALSKINLMNYGHEFGENTTFTSDNSTGILNCKGWCLDDHLIGLEIEYSNIEDATFTRVKNNFDKQFINYKIIWTRVSDR